MKRFRIDELRPNNWYVNRAKLDRVRSAWANGEEASLPPVLVTHIDGELSLIDGHARTLGAFEAGAIEIPGEYQPLEEIEGSRALYEHIHRRGPEVGVRSVEDLVARVVSPEDHERLWIGYCEAWLRENQRDHEDSEERSG
ncbi:MAG: hypothetical protein GF405_03145 [Candidatus Eisenbacteria bacterium]|nr:hypothetical protein [Candidatus Eisenbacteria bacterium]